MDLTGINWVQLGITLLALAVGWFILKTVLKLTMKVFSIGCTGLLFLAGVLFAMSYFQ